ncbi:MAG: response regulator [Aristaeellaceae bacterium]
MNIMAVDDERIALSGLELILNRVAPGAEIVTFRQAEDALAYASGVCIDVAFLDVRMQGINGISLAQQLQDMNPEINIIFVTGFDEYAREAISLHASGYITKPVTLEKVRKEMEALRFPVRVQTRPLLRVQCFGNFEVFTPSGKPLHFTRTKAKEAFAYLVYRRGASCTSREVAAVLFQDAPYDEKRQAYFQQIIHAMMQSLRQAGAECVILKRYKSMAINPEAVDCDFYRYLKQGPDGQPFMGEYMAQYGWAEDMVGYLDGEGL